MTMDVLRSEFCKLRSVRSTYWLLFATVAFNVGVAAPVAVLLPDHLKANFDPVSGSLGGLHLSQIAMGVLGVLAIASEYDNGLIRSTLGAVPRRGLVLLAKATAFTTSAVTIGVVASFAAYFVFQAFLADESLRSSIDDPEVLRAVLGGGLYLTVLGLMGIGLGALFRGSAAAIAMLLGIIFVPQLLMQLMPQGWQTTISPYLPMEAGRQIYSVNHQPGNLGFWSGLGTLTLYAAAALSAGFVQIVRRDA
jgi:ABC-type transport system involved in multi-copper enzyme maturation permease subunit